MDNKENSSSASLSNQDASLSPSKGFVPSSDASTSEDKTSVTPQQLDDALKNLNKSFVTKIEELNGKLKPIEGKVSDASKQLQNYFDKIEEVKDKVIQTLAIFVALFTFVSVNFSFLTSKNLNAQDFLAIDLLLSGTLILFILLFRFLIREKNGDNNREIFFIVIASGLIILGILIMGLSKSGLEFKINTSKNEPEEGAINSRKSIESTFSGTVIEE
ncbi:hypothetical protein HYS96_03840 [Candidatus Daviesbacteria bacterium]|nr:hypothetical protein [Candidatus Daviesbacteria bacterium]